MTNKPQKVVKHGFHIALLLIITVIIGSIGVGFLVQRNPYIVTFDRSVYEAIQFGPRSRVLDILIWPFNFDFLSWSGRKPSYIYFLVGGFVLYMFIKKRSEIVWALITLGLASILIVGITELDWHFVNRKRPFSSLPNVVDQISQQSWSSFSSYPSGHTRETALYGTVIMGYIPEIRIVMWLFILFIAYSRLYLGAHYPTDVIAALLIGYITAQASLMITKEFQLLVNTRRAKNQAPQSEGTHLLTPTETK